MQLSKTLLLFLSLTSLQTAAEAPQITPNNSYSEMLKHDLAMWEIRDTFIRKVKNVSGKVSLACASTMGLGMTLFYHLVVKGGSQFKHMRRYLEILQPLACSGGGFGLMCSLPTYIISWIASVWSDTTVKELKKRLEAMQQENDRALCTTAC